MFFNQLKVVISAIIVTTIYYFLNYYGYVNVLSVLSESKIFEIYIYSVLLAISVMGVIISTKLPSERNFNNKNDLMYYDDIIRYFQKYCTDQVMITSILASSSIIIIGNPIITIALTVFSIICSVYNIIGFEYCYYIINKNISS